MKITKIIPLFLLASVGLSGCSFGNFFQPFIPSFSEDASSKENNLESSFSEEPISIPQGDDSTISDDDFYNIISVAISNETAGLESAYMTSTNVQSNQSYTTHLQRTEYNGHNFVQAYNCPLNGDMEFLVAAHLSSNYKSIEYIYRNSATGQYYYGGEADYSRYLYPYVMSFGYGDLYGACTPAAFIACYGNLIKDPQVPLTSYCDNIHAISENAIEFTIRQFGNDPDRYANVVANFLGGYIQCVKIRLYGNDGTHYFNAVIDASFGARSQTPYEIYEVYMNHVNGGDTSSSSEPVDVNTEEYMVLMGPHYINGFLNDWEAYPGKLPYAAMYETSVNDLFNDSLTLDVATVLQYSSVSCVYRIDNVEFGTYDAGWNEQFNIGVGTRMTTNGSYSFKVTHQTYNNGVLDNYYWIPGSDNISYLTSNLCQADYAGNNVVTGGAGIYTVIFVGFTYGGYGFGVIKVTDLEGIPYVYEDISTPVEDYTPYFENAIYYEMNELNHSTIIEKTVDGEVIFTHEMTIYQDGYAMIVVSDISSNEVYYTFFRVFSDSLQCAIFVKNNNIWNLDYNSAYDNSFNAYVDLYGTYLCGIASFIAARGNIFSSSNSTYCSDFSIVDNILSITMNDFYGDGSDYTMPCSIVINNETLAFESMSASINANGVFDSNSVVIEMYNEYGERELPPEDIVDTYNNWLSQQ